MPGYHTVKATVHVDSGASRDEFQKVFDRVVKYSPVGLTISQPVDMKTALVYNSIWDSSGKSVF